MDRAGDARSPAHGRAEYTVGMESSSGPSAGQCSPIVNPYELKPYGGVAYIEGELGEFLLRLRGEVVPGCALRSHVSILPPRPIRGSEDEAAEWLTQQASKLSAFQVRLGKIEVFPGSRVIYVALDAGGTEMGAMHELLNLGPFQFEEEYRFHPHVTLAQRIAPESHAAILERCEEAWAAYQGPRSFAVETLTFVKNISFDCWRNLRDVSLEMAGTRR